MANTVYTKFMDAMASGTVNWETAVLRALLERSTTAYSVDPDHNFVSDFTTGGGVEISVASYLRQTLANAVTTKVDASNHVILDSDNPTWGALETGQTVKAIILYVQTGGSDATPEDDILIAYFDTASNGVLPAVLGGGSFDVTVAANGWIRMYQP